MRIEADTSQVTRLAKKLGDTALFEKEFGGVWKDANQNLFIHCFREAPRDQGQLQKSMAVVFPYNLSSEIGTDDSKCPYAKFVYGGTIPHKIEAERRVIFKRITNRFGTTYNQRFYSSLSFVPKGSFDSMLRSAVWHKGSKPNPYLLNSYNKHEKEFTNELETGATEILEAL